MLALGHDLHGVCEGRLAPAVFGLPERVKALTADAPGEVGVELTMVSAETASPPKKGEVLSGIYHRLTSILGSFTKSSGGSIVHDGFKSRIGYPCFLSSSYCR